MLFALFAAVLFACSGVCAQRSSLLLGPMKANVLRLGFACVVLALAALRTHGIDFGSEAAQRLYLSGLVGFGLGDMALFFAMPRLGARLTLLINLCTAPLFGLFGDMVLLNVRLQPVHLLGCVIILAGVSIALLGARTKPLNTTGSRVAGILSAFIAGCGQGTGATLSRWAQAAEASSGVMLPSYLETLMRVVPGFAIVALFWWWARSFHRDAAWAAEKPLSWLGGRWIVANALCGAIVGVTCFQHALLSASSAVVLSVTATTPIIVMPMVAYSEGDVPSARSVAGAALAVAGVVMLKLLSA